MPYPLVAVYGTNGGDFDPEHACTDQAHWWHGTSYWWAHMRTLGCVPFRDDDFVWTGGIDGLSWRRLWSFLTGGETRRARHTQWFAGGQALCDYIKGGIAEGRDPHRFIVVAHSHGGQVALYAAADKIQIPLLITVATPRRADMRVVTALARPNVGFWIHVYDRRADLTATAGAIGDGDLCIERTQQSADLNIAVDGIDHSGLLMDPSTFPLWRDAVFSRLAVQLADW